MLKQRRLLLLIAFAIAWISPARADVVTNRLALLIGNDDYQGEIKKLKNSYHDARLIATALERDGFEVKLLGDKDRAAILEATQSFAAKLTGRGGNAVGFFYYAGHGAADAFSGENYLIPIDVQDVDAKIWGKSVKVGEIVKILAKASETATQFVIFDACREDLDETQPGTLRVGFTPIQQEAAMLVGFSTAPGKIAADGAGNNGPYALALATELAKPGLDALLMFANVQRSVWSTIGQDPWINHPTLPEVYFAGPLALQDANRHKEADSLIKQARIDTAFGRSDAAAEKYQQAVDLLSEGGWATDPLMASALKSLGVHYMLQRRFTRALPLLHRSLSIYSLSLGDKHRTEVSAIMSELSKIKGYIEKPMR